MKSTLLAAASNRNCALPTTLNRYTLHSMPGVNERIAASVRAHRERMGISQAELAAHVTAEGKADGVSWHQSTTARVEDGAQRLRLDEAEIVARVLGIPVNRLTWATGEAAEVMLAERAMGRLHEAFTGSADATARLHAARAGARSTLRTLAASGSERAREAARSLEDELAASTVRAATAEGKARYEREAAQ